MLNLSLAAISRGGAEARWRIPPDDPLWEGSELVLREPVEVAVEARPVGDGGVLVRGRIRTVVEAACRRCVSPVVLPLDQPLDLLFESLQEDEVEDLAGEVYPLPQRGGELDLSEPLREQLMLHAPQFVVCREECRGLCPHCGTDMNQAACECVPAPGAGPWDALKKITFD